jgi:hypothetical protein
MTHSKGWVVSALLTLAGALCASCAGADSESDAPSVPEATGETQVALKPGTTKGFITCGGIAGRRCPAGLECVDDPRDSCSPCKGGADCGGICVEASCPSTPSCNPGLICTQVITCVDGLLYPTGCGPRNCDKAIGPCDSK